MEKRGLGRGLAALIADTQTDEGAGQVREVPIGQIEPNPYQPRTQFDGLKMEELALSIKEHGILQPILLRRVGHERFQLVAGERRYRAAQMAGLASVPALVKDLGNQEQLEIAVIENLQREDIGAVEAARAYRRLLDEFGLTQEQVAQRVGKSRSSIANTVRLLSLPQPVLDSLESGGVSEGHARALLSMERESDVLRVWRVILDKGLSVRETERMSRISPGRAASSDLPVGTAGSASGVTGSEGRMVSASIESDPNEAAVVDALQGALGSKVTIRRGPRGTGRIEIEFYNDEDLERLLALLAPGRSLF